jgi:hypothetical protein
VLEQLGTWEDQSHDFIRSFAGKFGAEDVVEKFLNRRRLVAGDKRTRSPSSHDVSETSSLSASSSSTHSTPH